MAKQTINIGSAANDGTGSTLREAFDITNDNFTELYDGTGGLFHKIEGTNFTGSLLIGHSTTGTLSSAQNNTGVGINSLKSITSGDANIGLGTRSGFNLTTALGNILIGNRTGENIIDGSYNVAIGDEALFTENGHGKNIAIGYHALRAQDAGADAQNVAIGHQAGKSVTTGSQNTMIGSSAGDALTSGTGNVALGWASLSSETTGNRNTAVGWKSLQQLNNTGSAYNVAFGYEAGLSISTGIRNTILGGQAGNDLTTGSNNTIIGYDATASAVGVSNEVTIGNSSIANVRIPADSTLKIGASGDLQLEHLSGNSFIKNTDTGDLYIENQVDDASIIFRCDDGSGGLDTYFSVVGAGNRVQYNKNLRLIDNAVASFGSDDDLQIYHDGTTSNISNINGNLSIINHADDADIKFFSDDGSGGVAEYFRVDGSSVLNIFSKDIRLMDSVRLNMGDQSDLHLRHNGTNAFMTNSTGDLTITNETDDGDIIFISDDGSGGVTEYFKVDGGLVNTVVLKDFRFEDNVKAAFGSSQDLKIYHTGTGTVIQNATGNLTIQEDQNDGDIIFRSDDGGGGTAEYFKLDGSEVRCLFSVNAEFSDNVKAKFGTSDDLQIYHDGSDSYIKDSGTGDLRIDTSKFRIRNAGGTESIIIATENGSVDLYYNDSKKFETTSAGATVTGTLTANTGHVNIDSGYSFQWDDTHERIEQSDGKIEFFANNTQQMTLSGANLGIGTDSPGALLHLANTSGGPIYLEDTDATDTFDITSISNGGGNFSLDTRRTSDGGFVSTDYQIVKNTSGADYHRWLTQGSERMRINASGDVLVGTTGAISTGNGLSINSTGQMRIGRASTGSIKQIIFSNPNDEVGSISTSGSATAFNTSSDYRLKEDLKDFDGLDKISKIPVYDFKWKVDDSRSYGVLAHELQEVVPNAVNGEKDAEEMQGVDYSKIVPVLIKAIQELEARVKTLENK